MDLIQTKLNNVGGRLDALSEADQEKYRQLTGQSGWNLTNWPHIKHLNHSALDNR